MKVGFKFRHLESSEALKNHAIEKFARIEKYLDTEVDEIEVVFSTNAKRTAHRVDIQIISRGAHTFISHEETPDMYTSIDTAVEKLEKQLRRTKDALQSKRKDVASAK